MSQPLSVTPPSRPITANAATARRQPHRRPPRRKGVASMMAMVFLTLFGTLSVAMISMSTLNAQSADNLADVERARAAAEAGLRWQAYRLRSMPKPRTLSGRIDANVANALWPSIKTSIASDYAAMTNPLERTAPTDNGTSVICPRVTVASDTGQSFQVTIAQDPTDARNLIVTSEGRFGSAVRKMSMTFAIDKKVKFAIVGKVPIQIGRNTIVEGNVAMAVPNKFPPILMLSDFTHFDTALKTKLDTWNAFLQGSTNVNGVSIRNHNGYDNRINVNNPVEYQLASTAGYTDINTDGYIDEYDLFVKQYDTNGDRKISRTEFTNPSTGKMYDENLFAAMDATGAPLQDGDAPRDGLNDQIIDNRDGYAKVRGTLTIAAQEKTWSDQLAATGKKINDMIQGTVATVNPTDVAVKFGASSADLFDLDPANFESCAADFKSKTGSAAGTAVRDNATRVIANTTLSLADVAYAEQSVQVTAVGGTSLKVGDIVSKADFDAANAAAVAAKKTAATATNGIGTAVERTPFGSTSWQATYRRPIFRNMTFRNVIIPKGFNAVFDNCKFEGVTFVETDRDITKSNGTVTTSASDGMSWAQRMLPNQGTFNANTAITPTTNTGASRGNNLRFNDCTFNGPLAGNYATAYTHFANSWEFTGKTMFDNKWKNPTTGETTATIVSPQVNIEMGSFTDPAKAPSTLIGVIVAGNIDIRGYSNVDGSIIITGDGAGNTTLAYFGANDGDTNPNAMPEGGYGKLNIRYNPYRSLPDGINIPIDITPNIKSYTELSR